MWRIGALGAGRAPMVLGMLHRNVPGVWQKDKSMSSHLAPSPGGRVTDTGLAWLDPTSHACLWY